MPNSTGEKSVYTDKISMSGRSAKDILHGELATGSPSTDRLIPLFRNMPKDHFKVGEILPDGFKSVVTCMRTDHMTWQSATIPAIKPEPNRIIIETNGGSKEGTADEKTLKLNSTANSAIKCSLPD